MLTLATVAAYISPTCIQNPPLRQASSTQEIIMAAHLSPLSWASWGAPRSEARYQDRVEDCTRTSAHTVRKSYKNCCMQPSETRLSDTSRQSNNRFAWSIQGSLSSVFIMTWDFSSFGHSSEAEMNSHTTTCISQVINDQLRLLKV